MAKLPKTYVEFKRRHPKVWRAYERLGSTAAEEGPLPEKTRELVKLGMAAGIRAESALKAHVHRALDAKATPGEVEHAVRLGITTLGFPGMMTALVWTREAIASHGA